MILDDVIPSFPEEIVSFAADGDQFDIFSFFRFDNFDRSTNYVAVKRPTQSSIGGDDHNGDASGISDCQEGVAFSLGIGSQVSDDVPEFQGIGTGFYDIFLSPSQPCRRHHFHGFGDLLG